MITFKSRNNAIKQADRITRSISSIYPHISESRTNISIERLVKKHSDNKRKCYQLSNLMFKNSTKLDKLRYRGGFGLEQFRIIISNLKEHKIGNCYEETVLAQIIGKLSGLKNIYPASIYYKQISTNLKKEFDHAVAVITYKPFEKDHKYQFKNKDAIILDPWLGITEFAGDYFTRLKTQFNNMFSHKVQDAKEFYLKLHDEEVLPEDDINILKKEYPELILEKFNASGSI